MPQLGMLKDCWLLCLGLLLRQVPETTHNFREEFAIYPAESAAL